MDCKMESPLGFWGTEAEEMLMQKFPLHKACRDGDPVTLSRLAAESTPDVLTAEDQFYSWTPIHWASYFGKNDCLNGLLHCGVDVNIKTSKFQQTPSHIAAFGGHPNTLLDLIKAGANCHARDYLGEIPLHKAARVGNVECLKVLLSNGTRVDICNNNGQTAGDIARNQHFIDCVRWLEQFSHAANHSKLTNGTNGFHLTNGMSGSHVFRSNGHSNGMNGHSNGIEVTNRKRTFDDVSIPVTKRARTGCHCEPPPLGAVSAVRHPSKQPFPSQTYLDREVDADHEMEECSVEPPVSNTPSSDHDLRWNAEFSGSIPAPANFQNLKRSYCDDTNGCGMEFETNSTPSAASLTHYADDVPRAPSPGMDLTWHRDDLQVWGHLQGYGDTAESLPDDDFLLSGRNIDGFKTCPQTVKGVQARGWR